jgi:hypothetical protein
MDHLPYKMRSGPAGCYKKVVVGCAHSWRSHCMCSYSLITKTPNCGTGHLPTAPLPSPAQNTQLIRQHKMGQYDTEFRNVKSHAAKNRRWSSRSSQRNKKKMNKTYAASIAHLTERQDMH